MYKIKSLLLCALIMVASCMTVVNSFASSVILNVPGTSDPWLAGMPDDTMASGGDVAPDQSPVELVGLPVVTGAWFTFTVTGQVRHSPFQDFVGPDGNAGWIASHDAGAENGISHLMNVPINALTGVFLDASQPDSSATPPGLDFDSNLNFAQLFPTLRQVFFIGDGFTSTGVQQQFQVPSGATRLFLATMDSSGYYNNQGSFTVQATVPEPSTFLVSMLGLIGFGFCGRRRNRLVG